jgi:two-component system nitrate/nitrite response regulator NarP
MRWNGDDGRRLRLLVGDRQPLFADAIAAMLIQHGHAITTRAANGADAAAAIAGGGIDIALLDVELANPSPLTLLARRPTKAGTAGNAGPAIVLMVPGPGHPSASAAIAARPDGLVLKSNTAAALHECIGAIIAGGRWIDPAAAVAAASRIASAPSGQLTRREGEIARLVATGERNRSIGDRLGISEGTVKMHLHNVYAKLGIETRTQLAMDERVRSSA